MSQYPLRIAPDEPEIPEPLDALEIPEPLDEPEIPEPLDEPEIPEPIDEPEIPEPLVDEDPDDLDALGGGGGGSESRAAGGNASSPASPPAGTPPETSVPVLRVPTPQGPVTPKPTTTPTTNPRMTTTTILTPFTELVCTVSGYLLYTYPPDGLCHYLFYWDAVVFRKTIRDVGGSHSWDIFKDQTARLKKTSRGISFNSRTSKADTVIAISSVGWLYNSSRCELTPPSVWDTSALPGLASTLGRRYPDLRRHAALMSKHQSNFDLKVKMGLSFELATLVYNVSRHLQAVNVAMIHSECQSLFTANFDIVPCKKTLRSTRGLVHPDVSIGVLDDVHQILLFEDEDTLQKKCRDLLKPSTDLRPNMVMLLFNVHLGGYDERNRCGSSDPLRADPFWRVRVVKRTLNIP
ncbi:uncharacterized protein [Dermacentor albipictus]|uniref:uncharacterized protein isoform X16 n=1 Tax=Dermacentor albipictus TaxID=60249 RepID=UPI0038FCDC8C